jgi:DNA-binding transcriptional ArsR family regulator
MVATKPHVLLATKAKLFRGLGDPSRLAVLEGLRAGARCVTDVVELTGLSQPNVSGHLACLLDCGLVVREQRGRFAYYSISGPQVEAVLVAAETVLGQVSELVDLCCNYSDAGQNG